ncbi:hypothetical protein [Haloarcula sediminis]|uniref:hypothetical protein n=1 Tax=Haloarcula sediminis TaxID=3111777 RepID=UPI002D785BD4|nr:hypothetical protein [Haloarcula sp. CK38]
MSDTLHDTTGMGMGSKLSREVNPCDTDAVIEAIERPNQYEPDQTKVVETPSGTFEEKTVPDHKWRYLPKMDLPGFGELGDDCGDSITQFCECCADSWSVGSTCGLSTCPRCAQTWVRESATQIASKLKGVWAKMWSQDSEHPYFQHLVVDIPDDWELGGDPETIYWRTLDVIKEIMDAMGIAGVPIYHPYRGDEETPDDRGEWADRLFSDKDWSEVSDELEFDPHFHIIGVAPFVDCTGVERIQSETGWPIHRITQEDSSISIGSDYDMAGVVAYCLSHAGIYEDTNGDMSAAAHTRIAERPWSSKNAWMDGDAPEILDRTREQMDKIVRSVAPKVLGVEFSTVACVRKVPEENAANTELSLAQNYDEFSGDGDGDGSGAEEPEPEPEEDVTLVTCQGRALHIERAPEYLNNDDWRESADYARDLEQKYDEYLRENGVA